MKKIFLFIKMTLVLFLVVGCSQENRLSATVISVTDGDTIRVKLVNGEEERVRLTLVDTPETKHPRLGEQPFGQEASDFTTEQLTGKEVLLELDVQERDQYGRLLAYVWVDDTLYNEVLIEKGYARIAVFPPNTKYVDQFEKVQKKAQEDGVGIWSIENYVQERGFDTDAIDEVETALNNETNCVNQIKGNKNSKIYHLTTGAHYDSISEHNIIWFCSEEEAEKAGFRASKR
ncbi:thermonuclease family protein [Bacillus sp. B15-48]|uniref:thermonuclease family protein n=1 Tax=Bacillus sp. B15-48 TaxID=1548601 RepID=UPI00193F3ED2|nr:thermonuclease family protein [Bacillus sp. B15-48]MBM4763406.1 thermonuclease [Bacillus sp. B15-48]